MRKTLLALAAVLCFSGSALAVNDGGYASFGIGGDLSASGYTSARDPRFELQFEGGYGWLGVPVSLSFGQDILIVGVKPRLQYWITPLRSLPKLSVAPGIAPVFNYWRVDTAFASANVVEFGVQPSFQIRYNVIDSLFVNFTPVALDFNFWRHGSGTLAGTPVSGSSSDLGVIYTIMASAGIHF